MWREIVAVKRLFKYMQTAMKNEVIKMGHEINNVSRDINSSCSNVSFVTQQEKRALEENLKSARNENNDLQAQLATLKVQYESARHEVIEREQRLMDLMNQLKKLEDRCAQAESQAALANRYNDEIDRLNSSIREIAQAVVQDADNTDREAADAQVNNAMAHMHLSRDTSSAPAKSPRRGSTRGNQAFAEGTISAVQAALHKYQLALHDMQVKFQNTSETLRNTKGQLDVSEDTKHLLTNKVQQLTEKLDMSNSKLSELLKERESLQKTLDEIRAQKQLTEHSRAELNTAVS